MKRIVWCMCVCIISLMTLDAQTVHHDGRSHDEHELLKRRNIVYTYPIKFAHKTASIGYERLFWNGFSAEGNFMYSWDNNGQETQVSKVKEAGVYLNYYFWETHPDDFEMSYKTLKNISFSAMAGIGSNNQWRKGLYNTDLIVKGGVRMQVFTWFNATTTVGTGMRYIVKDEASPNLEGKIEYVLQLRLALGYRF